VRYVHSLWDDAYNPLFRQLVQRKQIEILLLAVLVHDLGQYPFGHTIEELGEEFRHENLSSAFLDNPTRDNRGNTLREIIESSEFGWEIEIAELKRFLSLPRRGGGSMHEFFTARNLVEEMLHSILDGPIDVDKLDYLVRDSHMCFLNYGNAIDSERLIANLTIVIHNDKNGRKHLSLGAYERGEPAAEALSFARYLLYQTLYWHHTSRAGRSMFLAAIAPLATQKKASAQGKKAHSRSAASGSLMAAIAKFLAANEEIRTVTLADVLDFFEKRVDKNGQEIIKLIRSRQYYKRLYTIHEGNDSHISLKDFRAAVKSGQIGERLRGILRKRFEALLNAQQMPGNSLLTPEKGNRALALLAEPNTILCDAPRPSIGADNNLFFVPAPQRLEKNLSRRHTSGERVSAVWNRVHEQLMSIAAKGRVFCHPDIRDPLMALLSPTDIENCILEAMRK
jgi:HD superfamily phosphohydrolase